MIRYMMNMLIFFSVMALDKLLQAAGLEIFKVEGLKVHGGSNRIYAKT